MFDPYLRAASNDPIAPATAMIPITPDDNDALPIGIKALRIFNGTGAIATIAAYLVGDAENPVTFTVPVGLTVEPIRVARLLVTGTTATAGLELFGYTDKPIVLTDY